MKQSRLLLLLTFAILLVQCTTDTTSTKENESTETADATLEKDKTKPCSADSLAKFLAGMQAYTNGVSFDQELWNEHAKNLDENWAKMEKTRFNPMNDWIVKEIDPKINDSLPLYYPFSGPDFLHAHYLFPNASDYLMLALEEIGEIPDFNSMTQEEISEYLNNVNLFLRDIYRRSYFITKNMDIDLAKSNIKGILPILYVFIARTGHDIIDVERITLNAGGTIVVQKEKNQGKLDGVRFKIRAAEETKIKELIYWDCDLSDKGFDSTPELLAHISSLGDCNTFLKSASYLLHYNSFSRMRKQVIRRSEAVLEDDTGVPYSYFETSKWKPHLYGKYSQPVKDFSAQLWQTDLDEAYADPKQYAGELAFSLGYHWSDGVQNYMLFVKK